MVTPPRTDRWPTMGARRPWARIALSLFLIFHLVGMGASLGKKTRLGSWVRTATAPYERLLGIWQSWGMFGPDPPLGTSWLRVAGTTAAGDEFMIQPLVGERPFERTDLRYNRLQKVERNMLDKRKQTLRRGYAAWICRTWQGPTLDQIQIWKDRTRTPKPGRRDDPPTVKRYDLSHFSCEEIQP